MNKIIQLDENTRIRLIPDNYLLQFKQASRTKRIAWHTEGYYPNLTSVCQSYLQHAPRRAIHSAEGIEGLVEVVQQAKETIKWCFQNNSQ